MVFDAASRAMVLFGGEDEVPPFVLGDTWTWDGSVWKQEHPANSPSPRPGAAIAYDAARRQVVLFGGRTECPVGYPYEPACFANDTWTWDGRNWTEHHPVSAPALDEAAAVFDEARGTVVLVGLGCVPLGDGIADHCNGLETEVWSWDGVTWTRRQPQVSPPARSSPSLAYDNASSQVVLFGGRRDDTGSQNDTWTWDGTAWTKQRPIKSPTRRLGAAIAYDRGEKKMVLFGGLDGKDAGDTWSWDGANWQERAPAKAPPPRRYAVMATNGQRGGVVLFGGDAGPATSTSNYGDLWRWDGTTWTRLA